MVSKLMEVMQNAQSALAELSAVRQTDSERVAKLQQLQATQTQLKSSVSEAEAALKEREKEPRMRSP